MVISLFPFKLTVKELVLYKAKAPGSLMLFGEYAVLQGKTAIVAAINKFISVSIILRRDEKINIDSSLGQFVLKRSSIDLYPPFEFVLAALASTKLPSGCNIFIESDLPNAIGLGSSAAVTVATLTALNACLKTPLTKRDLWEKSIRVIRTVQGKGSGADCAASIYGGAISFRNQPFSVTLLKSLPPITAIYSGKKLTTAQAIDIITKRRQAQSDFYYDLDQRIDKLALKAIDAINVKDWVGLGCLFNEGQALMEILGVSNEILASLLAELRKQTSIFGAKISGAGLGDCVIGIGRLISDLFPRNKNEKNLGIKQIPLRFTAKGVNICA